MRLWVTEHFAQVVHCVLALAMLVLLLLLSWGISTSNLVAAVISGAGLAVCIVLTGSALLIPDNLRSQATERTLRLASSTLNHMRGGLTEENCRAVCQLLLPETHAVAIAMTDTVRVLAYVGELAATFPPGSPNTDPTKEVIESGRMQTFLSRDVDGTYVEHDLPDERASRGFGRKRGVDGFPAGIIVPLIVADRPVGTVKLYYRHAHQIDRTQLRIARGLAELLSTQLSAYELDRQAELTARAEVKALQAQINPHFLFNTLNTIASFTRTDPTKARDLLREFSVFYRRTLEGAESNIPLIRELEQVRRYLKIERARFGDDRIVESEYVERGLEEVPVPSFLIQPIVENAVRHAMRDEGPLHIDIHVGSDGGDVLIAVLDDGLGMDEDVAERLLHGDGKTTAGGKGTGIALRNVAERVERYYGVGSGIEIMSKPGEGTSVTLRLANAARDLRKADA